MVDRSNYIIPLDNLDLTKILKTWTWLIGEDKTVAALTKMGEALLKDNEGKLYHLDTGKGEISVISEHYQDFFDGKLSDEIYEEILLPELVDELEASDKILKPGKVYAFYKLPLLGGTYQKENIYSVNLYEHYSLTGELQLQLKDLPDGTEVVFKITE